MEHDGRGRVGAPVDGDLGGDVGEHDCGQGPGEEGGGGGAGDGDDGDGRLDVLGDVDALLEALDARGHLHLGRDAGRVEGVGAHLGGGLADALGGDGAGHVARGADGPEDAGLGGPEDARLLGGVPGPGPGQAGGEDELEALGRAPGVGVEPGHGGEDVGLGERQVGAPPHDVPDEAVDVEGHVDAGGVRLGGAEARGADGRPEAEHELRDGRDAGETRADLGVAHDDLGDDDALEAVGLEAVVAVDDGDDLAPGVAHGAVVAQAVVLHVGGEAAVDVARGGGLDGRVDEPLAAAHGVEEELGGGEPDGVGVDAEAAGLGRGVAGGEAREGAARARGADAAAVDHLLAHEGAHLGDVHLAALAAGAAALGHGAQGVAVAEGLEDGLAAAREDVLEDAGRVGLDGGRGGARGAGGGDVGEGRAEDPADPGVGGVGRGDVVDADGEAVAPEPAVEGPAGPGHEVGGGGVADVEAGDVDDAPGAVHPLLAHAAGEEGAAAQAHVALEGVEGVRGREPADALAEVDGREELREDLLARVAARPRAVAGEAPGHGGAAARRPAEDVGGVVGVEEDVARGEVVHGDEAVLDHGDGGPAGGVREDVVLDGHEARELGAGVPALGVVEVHLCARAGVRGSARPVPASPAIVRGCAVSERWSGGRGHAHTHTHTHTHRRRRSRRCRAS